MVQPAMLTWPLKFVKTTCSLDRLPGDLISRIVTKKSPRAVEAVPVITGSGARVEVGIGTRVGVGVTRLPGMSSCWPSERMSALASLLIAMMSDTETSNLRAISLSVSPDWTVYFCKLAGVGVLVGAVTVAATCVFAGALSVGTAVGTAARGIVRLASHKFKTNSTVTAETTM